MKIIFNIITPVISNCYQENVKFPQQVDDRMTLLKLLFFSTRDFHS